MINSTSSQ